MYYIYSTIDQGSDIVWRIVRTMQDLEPLAQFASHAEAMDWCRARGYAYELLVENGYDDDWDDEFNKSDEPKDMGTSRQQRSDMWNAEDLLSVEERVLLIETRWIPSWARSQTQTGQRLVGLVEAARAGRPWAAAFVEFNGRERDLVACTADRWAQALGVSEREAWGLIMALHGLVWPEGGWGFNT